MDHASDGRLKPDQMQSSRWEEQADLTVVQLPSLPDGQSEAFVSSLYALRVCKATRFVLVSFDRKHLKPTATGATIIRALFRAMKLVRLTAQAKTN